MDVLFIVVVVGLVAALMVRSAIRRRSRPPEYLSAAQENALKRHRAQAEEARRREGHGGDAGEG